MKKIITLLALFSIAVSAQGTFTDSRDGKKYKTVKIGRQTWMAQNLDYHGSDGYLGLCYGDNPKKGIRKPENCKKYGRLYDWNEAMKACPQGWHLPSYEEWQVLVDFAGGDGIAGRKLKAKSGWKNECKEEEIDNRGRIVRNACDAYGFSALPGGYGFSYSSDFLNIGDYGLWWTATEIQNVGSAAHDKLISYNDDRVSSMGASGKDTYLFSVRCLQGYAAAPPKPPPPPKSTNQFGHESGEDYLKRMIPGYKPIEGVDSCDPRIGNEALCREMTRQKAAAKKEYVSIDPLFPIDATCAICTYAMSDMEYQYSLCGWIQIEGQFESIDEWTGRIVGKPQIRYDTAIETAKAVCKKNTESNREYTNCMDGMRDRLRQLVIPYENAIVNANIKKMCRKELGSDSDEGANDPRYQRFRK